MAYPKMPDFASLIQRISLHAQLKHEYGARGIRAVLAETENALKNTLAKLEALPDDEQRTAREPSTLDDIRALRPAGPRRLREFFNENVYAERLEGALLARMAGCTLGAPVEGWPIDRMEELARKNAQTFPPTDYWLAVPDPHKLRYGMSTRESYTRDHVDGVPVDDDIAYTLLGLLVAEDHGPDFTTADVGKAWLRYLPTACTAERVALDNLKAGIPASEAADKNNPYCEWIGADIRADPWGYMAPGWPERAADMAHRDAWLSHRRQGIYGEMFFAAAIAAAFAVDDPVEALRIGLTEIPAECALAKALRWALDKAPEIGDYRQARTAVDRHFAGMHPVHTINNACLTVWGITIGGRDLTRVIGETVAMGLDNDCTAATAGSLVGAVIGKDNIPEQWVRRFHDTVHSYLIDRQSFAISDLVRRFTTLAKRVLALAP